MHVLSQVLAGPLASDHLWLILVLLAILVAMPGFRVAGECIGKRRRRRLQKTIG